MCTHLLDALHMLAGACLFLTGTQLAFSMLNDNLSSVNDQLIVKLILKPVFALAIRQLEVLLICL